MSQIDFSGLREGKADCPSDLLLDRFAVDALKDDAQRQVSAHVQACEICAGRMAARREGFAAFPDLDERKLLSAIRRRTDEEGVAEPQAPVATDAAWRPDTTNSPDSVRLKGGLALHVYRQRGDGAEELLSGDRCRPCDRLRFAVDLPKDGQISVIGIDQRGELYTAWPLAAESHAVATKLPQGRGQELPGAVTLDESLGTETLYLVHCPQAQAAPGCKSAGPSAEPSCPSGCSLVPFVLQKQKAP
jgi:hypothetical protein